jgi:hypothetical protein
MGRALLAAITGLLLIAVAGTPVRAHEKFRFVGVLSKIDPKAGTLDITYKAEGKDSLVTVYLTEATSITRDGKKLAKSALKNGLYVVVDAWGDDYDDLEALEIRVVPPPRK